MKFTTLYFIAGLLATSVNGVSIGNVVEEKRQLLGCIVNVIGLIGDLILPGPAAQASSFCSTFRAVSTTVSRTSTLTQVNTIASTVPVTATAVTTISAPAPTVTQIVYENCGIVGYDAGIAAYRSDATATTFAACQAVCRADAECASYATSSSNCLLYRVPVLSNTNPIAGSPNTFYDRNCPAPANARVKRAEVAAAPTSTPDFFEALPTPVLSSICSCLVPKAPTYATTKVQTITATRNVQSVVTKTVTTVVQTVGSAGSQTTVTVTTTA